jgi:hypothetical protein
MRRLQLAPILSPNWHSWLFGLTWWAMDAIRGLMARSILVFIAAGNRRPDLLAKAGMLSPRSDRVGVPREPGLNLSIPASTWPSQATVVSRTRDPTSRTVTPI